MTNVALLSILALSIGIIIFCIVKLKLHPFIALIISSIFVGVTMGMPLGEIMSSIEKGVAGTLGFLALIIGFGTILGKMLEVSGGAERIGKTMLNRLGQQRADIVMMTVGFIAGIPVFVEVGFVLLIPLVFTIAKEANVPLFKVGIPLAVALMTVHCMLPPHPAALAVTGMLGADVGTVILYGIIIGFPTAIISGPLWVRMWGKKLPFTQAPVDLQVSTAHNDLPGFGITLFTILLPLLIMISKTIICLWLPETSSFYELVTFLGNPITALFISVLVAYFTLGLSRGMSMDKIQQITNDCFGSIAGILLIIGAGGAFNGVLIDSGMGEGLGSILETVQINPIILAWLVAAIMHLAIGSATVAMLSAAGIVLPLLGIYPDVKPEIIVLAIGAGAIGWTHVNDSLFWLVKQYLGASIQDTFKYFTAATVLASFVSLGGILLLSQVV